MQFFEQGNLEGFLYAIVTKNFPVFFGMLKQLNNHVYDLELSQTSDLSDELCVWFMIVNDMNNSYYSENHSQVCTIYSLLQ